MFHDVPGDKIKDESNNNSKSPSIPLVCNSVKPNSKKILSDLKAVNIDISVTESLILEWLTNSDCRYLNVAPETLQIIQNRPLKKKGLTLTKSMIAIKQL